MSELPKENTDIHLFYEDENDEGYSPSCHMTTDRRLGIQVGGFVSVRSLREWKALESELKESNECLDTSIEQNNVLIYQTTQLQKQVEALNREIPKNPDIMNREALIVRMKNLRNLINQSK